MMQSKSIVISLWKAIHKDWHSLQYALLISLILMVNALPIWSSIGIHPQLYLVILYFSTLYYPPMQGLGTICLMGLLQDGIYGYPLGLSSLKFLLLHSLLLTQDRYLIKSEISLSWIGFAVFCAIDALIQNLLLSYIYEESPPFPFFSPGMGLTICLYPLSLKFLYWITKKVG